MLAIITFLSVAGMIILLIALSVIDLRIRLLPNELVFGFLILSFTFHLSTMHRYMSLNDMALGCIIGAGLLFTIRAIANFFYNDDALGLGDVKLLGAAGVLLGPHLVLVAMSIGALAGMAHGLIAGLYEAAKTKQPLNLATLSVPAGPGFALGIALTAIYAFRDLPEHIWP